MPIILFRSIKTAERIVARWGRSCHTCWLAWESENRITAGREAEKPGRFQSSLAHRLLADGSSRRLIDVANHNGLSF